MSEERKLILEKRLKAQEAKMEALSAGLNAILIDFDKIDEAKKAQKERPWDSGKVKWGKVQGAKGPYEKADPQATPDFRKMLADIKQHGGKLSRDEWFYWVFTDQATVGRKKR